MKKNILVLIIFAFSAFALFPQKKTDANIFGHIINKNSKEHLPYINITLKGTTIGTSTDATGHYILKNLPIGEFYLVVSAIGYKTVERLVNLQEGKTIEVNFEIEEEQIMLDGIVVSANRIESNRREAASIVNILTSKNFENTNAACLAQGLNYLPGLRVESNCQTCGFQQVRINGLDGPYSQILIDSRPIFSALAGVYGIEQIPANIIERVEVVRGGGSALFGSNAIAGIINIITKEPTSNSLTLSNSSSLIYGKSRDINTFLNASVVSDDFNSAITLFGSIRQRSPLDYNGDGFTEIAKLDLKNIGFKGFYRPNDYSKLTIEYHNLSEFRRGGNNLELPPHQSDMAEQVEHSINSGSFNYGIFSKNNIHHLNIYSSAQSIKRKSYYGLKKDPNAYGLTNDLTIVSGIQYTYSFDNLLFMPAYLTIGTEYSANNMDDKMIGYGRIINQKVNAKSVFFQNEWKDQFITILLGARFEKNNLIKNPIISPRINLRYNPTDFLSLRASYSSGFRSPQTFDEDLHINAVGGQAVIIKNDPNLKTEISNSFSASADFYTTLGKIQTNFLIEGFYTNLDNVFVLEEIGNDPKGNKIHLRRNGSGAVVKGFNFESKLVPIDILQIQFGFTFQKSQYKAAQKWSDVLQPQKRMFRAPNNYGYLTVNYMPFENINILLSGTYTGSMLVQHYAGYIANDSEKITPNFYNLNIKITYDLIKYRLQLNSGVQNIFNSYQKDFDKGVFRDSNYFYGPDLPRTFFAGFKVMI